MKTIAIRFFNATGMSWGVPLVKLFAGESVVEQLGVIARNILIPVLAILVFLLAWSYGARQVTTSLGQVPGPAMVFEQFQELWKAHLVEREKATAFYTRQAERNAKRLAANPDARVIDVSYTGKPTYIDQNSTSLRTVFMGFVSESLIALPLGILCGLSKTIMKAFNPLIQVFKPVSPLAWLPIVTMIVSAVYVSNNPMFPKSFVISAITVALCSLWATLINTALGVASVSTDYINVANRLDVPGMSTGRRSVGRGCGGRRGRWRGLR
jgi:nitrate/nitrite transport system permease protein